LGKQSYKMGKVLPIQEQQLANDEDVEKTLDHIP
jgi:hypothetical protein